MSNFFKTKIAGEQILDGAVKRQNLETSIVSDIDTLKENDVTKAGDIAQLQTDLTAEETARVSGDTALGIRVDGVEGDLSAEVTRAQAAEAQVLSDANSYTDTKVADLVNSAPAVLDTLKELSDALGSDPSFATTVANNIGEVAADIAAEETRALAAEGVLQGNIDAEETRAVAAEGVIASDLAAEVTRATGVEADLASDIAAEETRALAAEAGLASDITAEVTRAQGAETQLSNSISSEVTRAQGAEADLASDISAEESRAMAAEGALGVRIDEVESDIAAEETRAVAAEGVIASDLAAEVTRATGVEAGLASDIAAEETRALAAEADLASDIAAEVTRAQGVEAGLASDIADEETRALAAEGALSSRLNVLEQDPTTKTYVDQQVAGLVDSAPEVLNTLKELADAIGADANFSATISGMVGEVASDLAAEETRALAAEADLASDLAAEVTRAQGAEADLASDIAAEETRAVAAEGVIASDLAAEVTRATGVEADLASDIAAEETRALAAEGALGVRIDAVEADIAAEETRALAAEADLASDIAAEETRAVAAEAGLASDITAEETRALAAEAAIAADLISETSNRETADLALGVRIDGVEADLAAEVTDRTSADSALSTRISALEADATTKSYVDQKFAEVVDNAPAVLDTLNELAQAIGDDPAFITNISSTIDAVEASVSAEVTRAQGVEAGLASDIAAEETRALAAEAGLASDIADEETRALAAEAGLASDIAGIDSRVTTLEESAYIIREVPSGLINGTNTVFQLDSVPSTGTEQVYLNGLLQEAGASGDYTISGDTITFGVAPSTGYSLVVSYVTGAPVFNSVGSGSSSGFSGDYNDLVNKPSLFSGSYTDLSNKPQLFSGSYTDLSDKPSLFSGDYNDLINKPTIPSLTSVESRISSLEADATTKTYVDQQVSGLVNSAPAVLDTLKELADALGSDPAFATTVSNSIGAISSRVTSLESVTLASVATSGSYADLTNKPTLFSGAYADLTGTPSLASVATSGSYADLTNKPTLFSGSYADLTNKPTLFSGAYADLTGKPSLASVATSGSYADLSNKPTLASFTTLTSPASGHHLRYNGTSWVNAAIPASDLPVAQQSSGIIDTGFQIFSGDKRFNGIIQAYGGVAAKAPAINQPALRVQPAGVSQSIPLIYLENTSGGGAFTVSTSGATTIALASASAKGMVITAAASQTGNLFEVQNSAGTAKTSITKDGTIVLNALGNTTTYGIGVSYDLNGGTCLSIQHSGTAGRFLASFYNSAAQMVGSITHDGSTTSYATTSDHRLKENFVPLTGALDRVGSLPIYRFNFKANPSKVVDGCKAHEVAAVCPEAVNGDKDATDADGGIIPQSVDYSKLIPLLVASIQELKAKVAALESK